MESSVFYLYWSNMGITCSERTRKQAVMLCLWKLLQMTKV